MIRTLIGALILLACVTFPASAQTVRFDNGANDGRGIATSGSVVPNSARSRHRSQQVRAGISRHSVSRAGRHVHTKTANVGDPRPRAWCGWQMRQWFHVADRAYNVARKWASWGSPARGPAPGTIAVFARRGGGHVGIVTGVPGPGRIVLKSGNDGHAVRERERSTRGIIAYRWPPGSRYAAM